MDQEEPLESDDIQPEDEPLESLDIQPEDSLCELECPVLLDSLVDDPTECPLDTPSEMVWPTLVDELLVSEWLTVWESPHPCEAPSAWLCMCDCPADCIPE